MLIKRQSVSIRKTDLGPFGHFVGRETRGIKWLRRQKRHRLICITTRAKDIKIPVLVKNKMKQELLTGRDWHRSGESRWLSTRLTRLDLDPVTTHLDRRGRCQVRR